MNGYAANHPDHAGVRDATEQNIAEIIVARESYQTVLMPLIATFSHYDRRWLTWITDSVPSKEQLLAHGVNLRALRLIYISRHQDSRWLIWEALAQGNSHTIVTEREELTRQDIRLMESAATQGRAQGIIIRQR